MVDEFSELLTAKPDSIELFLAIGRIGRSIGVHLLLASQRLEEGRLRGLESFLSYRIGLRTFNAQESRAVLGSPTPTSCPRSPGWANQGRHDSVRGFESVAVEPSTVAASPGAAAS